MSWPKLFEPEQFTDKKTGKTSGNAYYSAQFTIDPNSDDFKALKAASAEVAKARWPSRELKEIRWPWVNGTKKADDRKTKGKEDGEYQRGKAVITSKSGEEYRPRLAVWDGRSIDLTDDILISKYKSWFFSGAEVLVEWNLKAYDGVGANPDGITAYLNLVLSTGKGDKLAGGGAPASEVFKGYVGHATEEDPTDIPF